MISRTDGRLRLLRPEKGDIKGPSPGFASACVCRPAGSDCPPTRSELAGPGLIGRPPAGTTAMFRYGNVMRQIISLHASPLFRDGHHRRRHPSEVFLRSRGMDPEQWEQESNMTDIRALNDSELEAVSGGMDCKTAAAVAKIYDLLAAVLGALGNTGAANIYTGMSIGVVQGGCG